MCYKTTGDTAVNSLQFSRGDSSGLLIKTVQCNILSPLGEEESSELYLTTTH